MAWLCIKLSRFHVLRSCITWGPFKNLDCKLRGVLQWDKERLMQFGIGSIIQSVRDHNNVVERSIAMTQSWQCLSD